MKTTRELYKQKYEAQLREWTAKVEEIKAHTSMLTAQASLDVKPHVDTLHDKVEAAKAKLHEIAEATEEKWDDMKGSADHTWNEFKAAIEGAYDAIKHHEKAGRRARPGDGHGRMAN